MKLAGIREVCEQLSLGYELYDFLIIATQEGPRYCRDHWFPRGKFTDIDGLFRECQSLGLLEYFGYDEKSTTKRERYIEYYFDMPYPSDHIIRQFIDKASTRALEEAILG